MKKTLRLLIFPDWYSAQAGSGTPGWSDQKTSSRRTEIKMDTGRIL